MVEALPLLFNSSCLFSRDSTIRLEACTKKGPRRTWQCYERGQVLQSRHRHYSLKSASRRCTAVLAIAAAAASPCELQSAREGPSGKGAVKGH